MNYISDKKTKISKFNDLDQIIEQLLSVLKPRPREIMVRRFGLAGKKPQVLDKIGKDFGVTRERIRQIERDSFKKLRLSKKSDSFSQLAEKAVKIIGQNGGFCDRELLKKSLVSDLDQIKKNQLMFILNSSADLSYNKGTIEIKGFWYLEKITKPLRVYQIHDFLVKFFRQQRAALNETEIIGFLEKSAWKRFFQDNFALEKLRMILVLSRGIGRNIMGQWGIKNWRSISERGTKEKAFLILKKYQEPYHFSRITELINKHWKAKIALSQTVHNELIKDRRFVLVGRGMYGLRDWGFEEGTVKEIIIQLLKKNQGSAEKKEILSRVLEKKRVKKTTILVNLADRKFFKKEGDKIILIQ